MYRVYTAYLACRNKRHLMELLLTYVSSQPKERGERGQKGEILSIILFNKLMVENKCRTGGLKLMPFKKVLVPVSSKYQHLTTPRFF